LDDKIEPQFDVSALLSIAQPKASRAARVYWEHTRQWFVGLLAHGSALKGGYIPGCSDIDFQLYLRDEAFDAAGNPLLHIGLAVQRDLAEINPFPFRYIQCYARPCRLSPKGEKTNTGHDIGPTPGAYHMIAGELPVPEATTEELLERARQTLDRLQPTPPAYISTNLIEHGGYRLERITRLLCTDVWPTLYSILVLATGKPLEVWKRPKDAVIDMLPNNVPPGTEIRVFYSNVWAHYMGGKTVESALDVISSGTTFLLSAREWYNQSNR
jgi:hypothetical protein